MASEGPQLSTPVRFLKGVGPVRAHQLSRLGIECLEDLLHHYPADYLQRSAMRPLATIRAGERAVTRGRLLDVQTRRTRQRRSMVTAVLEDGDDRLQLVWFNASYVAKSLNVGESILVHGEVREYRGKLQMTNPEYEAGQDSAELSAAALIPRYPTTAGLTQAQLRKLVRLAVEAVGDAIEDPVPAAWWEPRGWPGRAEAIRLLHEPTTLEAYQQARDRLAFDEALALQLSVSIRRTRFRRRKASVTVQNLGDLSRQFVEGLGFELTAAQRRVLRELRADLRGPGAMHRLLHGDVGAGKTVVAVLAMLWMAEAGAQAAFMAPTEVLARQQGERAGPPLAKLGVRSAVLTASTPSAERRSMLMALARGELQLLFGTHALLSDDVQFSRLGLAIVDEQHRFGVDQRGALARGGAHMLVMSATPIPRSLALTVYGDLDLSTLDELPAGRTPVETHVVHAGQLPKVYARVRDAAAQGEQTFLVFPRLEDGEGSGGLSAEAAHAELVEGPLAGLRVGLLHGRLAATQKNEQARAFAAGELDVLVATTVVEVGIDVAAATWMVVHHADLFGLAQLHQLRGRVGRGQRPGRCVLALGEDALEDARRRLEQVALVSDGLRLAELDLRERGMGDLHGSRQHGAATLRLLHPENDVVLLQQAQERARETLATDPELRAPAHRDLARWLDRLGARSAFWSATG